MCSLTGKVFIVMSRRLRAFYKRCGNSLRDATSWLCDSGNNNPDNGNFISLTAAGYNEIIFPRNRATNPRAKMSFMASTCGAPTHSNVRVEVMHFYRDTQRRIWKQVHVTCAAFQYARATQGHAVWNTQTKVSLVQCLQSHVCEEQNVAQWSKDEQTVFCFVLFF